MKEIRQEFLTGERALFHGQDLAIYDTTFADGESPLKGEQKHLPGGQPVPVEVSPLVQQGYPAEGLYTV